jgi:hypothetical protein
MSLDTANWSGEGTFTQLLADHLQRVDGVALVRVEDAPASRSEADYNFISNEIYVAFATVVRRERVVRFGFLPGTAPRIDKVKTLESLGRELAAVTEIGEPDYADEGMMQYLRTERIVPPYQTRGYKLVELVRVYEVGTHSRA